MENKVKYFIQENLIIKKPIVCAVSGGVDSVVMLNILNKLGYNVILAHVNHNKREESLIEMNAMKSLASNLSIPFELLDYHYNNNDNFHNDAHNARYSFFKELCEKYNTNIIATAHHLDDQIETVLIKLLEGSNLYGYGGISICNDDGKYKIIRPLLCLNKDEIYEYANQNKLEYFEDSSNKEDFFLRNKIRHNIIPQLKNECPDLTTKIQQYSIQLKEAFDYIRNQSIDYLEKTNNIIELDSFNLLDIAIKKDIISLLLEKNNLNKSNSLINNTIVFLTSNNGEKSLDLELGYKLIRSYNKAYILNEDINLFEETIINIGETKEINKRFKFYFSKTKPVNAKYIKLCYNNLELPFKIRNRKNGDVIDTLIGSKKVNRIFIDNKVSKSKRNEIPIIADNNDNILWVYDYVKSKDVYEQKNTGDIYFVCEVLYD